MNLARAVERGFDVWLNVLLAHALDELGLVEKLRGLLPRAT